MHCCHHLQSIVTSVSLLCPVNNNNNNNNNNNTDEKFTTSTQKWSFRCFKVQLMDLALLFYMMTFTNASPFHLYTAKILTGLSRIQNYWIRAICEQKRVKGLSITGIQVSCNITKQMKYKCLILWNLFLQNDDCDVASDVQAQFAIFHFLGAKMLSCQHFLK